MFSLICFLSYPSYFSFQLNWFASFFRYKKSISFTLLLGQDLFSAVLIVSAIFLTVASISAGVTASVSIKFLSIILGFTQSVFSLILSHNFWRIYYQVDRHVVAAYI